MELEHKYNNDNKPIIGVDPATGSDKTVLNCPSCGIVDSKTHPFQVMHEEWARKVRLNPDLKGAYGRSLPVKRKRR